MVSWSCVTDVTSEQKYFILTFKKNHTDYITWLPPSYFINIYGKRPIFNPLFIFSYDKYSHLSRDFI